MSASLSAAEARLLLSLSGLPSLRVEHAITRRVLAAIPLESADHRAADGTRTLGELARHIVSAELRFLEGVVESGFPELEAPRDVSAALDFYSESFPRVFERLEGVSGEHLVRELDYRGFIRMPALGFVSLALHHSIHHRGQLSVYLRTLGASVPPIYG